MRSFFLVVFATSLSFAHSGGVQSVAAEEPPKKAVRPAGPDFFPSSYLGKVVAVTDDLVTIKPEGDLKIPSITFDDKGKVTDEKLYIQDNTAPPRTFNFTEELLYHSGLNPNYRGGGGPNFGHKVTDLRVGDTVFISCTQWKGKAYTGCITIQTRPNGKIPPSMGALLMAERERAFKKTAESPEEKGAAALAKVALRFLR